MIREPIGEIDCPLCARPAELHSSDSRNKVSAEPEGRTAYPKKLFVICPPVPGYRGCGTLLCNNPYAQQRLLERGRIFGPNGKPAAHQESKPAPAAAPAPEATPAPAPASPPAKPASSPRGLFDRFR